MSTKKIREALVMCRSLPLADVAMERIEAAQAEVEAIEKAARVVVNYDALDDWNTAMPTDLASGIRTIQAIAKGTSK